MVTLCFEQLPNCFSRALKQFPSSSVICENTNSFNFGNNISVTVLSFCFCLDLVGCGARFGLESRILAFLVGHELLSGRALFTFSPTISEAAHLILLHAFLGKISSHILCSFLIELFAFVSLSCQTFGCIPESRPSSKICLASIFSYWGDVLILLINSNVVIVSV